MFIVNVYFKRHKIISHRLYRYMGLYWYNDITIGKMDFQMFLPQYSVMQSDWNSSKTDTFHEPATYEPHV